MPNGSLGGSKLPASLVRAVQEQRFLAVIGASGSGKSSVVRAGLVPALKRSQPGKWQVHIFTPSSHPLESLAVSLTRREQSVTAAATLIDDLQRDPRSLHLYIRRAIPQGSEAEVLFVVDQFEELFTQCRDEQERQTFVDNLLYAVGAEGESVPGRDRLASGFLPAPGAIRRAAHRSRQTSGIPGGDGRG